MDGFKLNFDKNQGILTIISEGVISSSMIVKLYESITEEKEYPRNLKILIVAPSINVNVKPAQVEELLAAKAKVYRHFSRLKEALVVDGPYNTMIATLYSERNTMPNFEAKVFSSKSMAINWLNE